MAYMWRIQIQQEPAGNYHSVADCRNKANKSLQKNVTCVASMYYCLLVHTSVHFTDPREQGGWRAIVPPVPHISGDLDVKLVLSNA